MEYSCSIGQSLDEYGWSGVRSGRDSCDHGRGSSDPRLLMYSQEVEDHSMSMYINMHIITQDRLPNRKKGKMESPVMLHHQSLDESTSSKSLLPDKDYM